MSDVCMDNKVVQKPGRGDERGGHIASFKIHSAGKEEGVGDLAFISWEHT